MYCFCTRNLPATLDSISLFVTKAYNLEDLSCQHLFMRRRTEVYILSVINFILYVILNKFYVGLSVKRL